MFSTLTFLDQTTVLGTYANSADLDQMRLIWVNTVCLQGFLLKNSKSENVHKKSINDKDGMSTGQNFDWAIS